MVQFIFDKNPDIYISPYQVLFTRSLIQAILTVMLMLYNNIHLYGGKRKNIWSLSLMGVFEASAIVLIYIALKKIPVGEATVIHFTAPVFTMLFSMCMARQCCSPIDGLFGMLSFVGVVIIGQPSIIEGHKHVSYWHHTYTHSINRHIVEHTHSHHHDAESLSTDYAVGCSLALIAAICFSWFYIFNKMTGKNTDVALTILYPSIFGMLISPVAMAINREHVVLGELKWSYWLMFLVVGCFGFTGMLLMGEAFQLDDPGPAVLIRNMDVVYAFVFQSVLLGKPPGLAAAVGTIIIISCTSIIALNRVFGLDRKLYGTILGWKSNDNVGETDSDSDMVPLLVDDSKNNDNKQQQQPQQQRNDEIIQLNFP